MYHLKYLRNNKFNNLDFAKAKGGEEMNANEATLADLLRELDQAHLDSGQPHTFKLLPNGELTIIEDVV